MFFDEEMLSMLFEETGLDFDAWSAQYDYSSMSDQEIYAALPPDIQNLCGDLGLNASWYHGGM